MEVRCDHCHTDYDFDDALVSDKGTTVKCTNCGHTFRVFRSLADTSVAPERWLVRTADGRDLVFLSLRELQKAILTKTVERSDFLSRGTMTARTLGSISELQPFFESAHVQGYQVVSASSLTTQVGVSMGAPAPAVRARIMTPVGLGVPQPPLALASTEVNHATLPMSVPVDPLAATVAAPRTQPPAASGFSTAPPPPEYRALVPSEAAGRDSTAAAGFSSKATLVGLRAPLHSELSGVLNPPSQSVYPSAALPLPPGGTVRTSEPPRSFAGDVRGIEEHRPIAQTLRDESLRRDSISHRVSLPQEGAEARSDSFLPPSRSAFGRSYSGRWMIGLITLGAVGVLGVNKTGQKWLMSVVPWVSPQQSAQPQSKTAHGDEAQVSQWLSAGGQALAKGDWEAAQEAFDKASALNGRDLHVRLALARLAAVRADVPWLRLRLLPASAKGARAMAESELQQGAMRARQAAEQAAVIHPDDLAVLRVQVDAQRLSQDLSRARASAAHLVQDTSEPETAYVLAALEMAEDADKPVAGVVIERLRLATTAEVSPGRARAALVYALSRSGDMAHAKAEFEPMVKASRPYVLLPELRAWLEVGGIAAMAGVAGVASAAASSAGTATLAASAAGARETTRAVGGGSSRASSGSRGGWKPRNYGSSLSEYSEGELQKKLDDAPASDTAPMPSSTTPAVSSASSTSSTPSATATSTPDATAPTPEASANPPATLRLPGVDTSDPPGGKTP